MHPRKEGGRGRARVPSPATPQEPPAPCPGAPPPGPPTNQAGRQVPGRPRQGGREPAAHFGLEGGSHRFVKAKGGVGAEGLLRQPAPTCRLPGRLGASWPGPPDRPPGPCPQASVTPRGDRLGRAAWEDDWGGIPHRTLGTLHSRNERKGRAVLVPQDGVLLTLRPSPGCHGPNPSALRAPNARRLCR